MVVRINTKRQIIAIAVGLMLTAGCSGHSVKYGATSEGEDAEPGQAETVGSNTPYAGGTHGQRQGMGAGMDEGTVNGSNSNMTKGSNVGMIQEGEASPRGMQDGFSGADSPRSSDYGQTYDGVGGSGPDHGPVTGFGSGQAGQSNPSPEQWSNAYLGKGDSSQEFYGDPSSPNSSQEPSGKTGFKGSGQNGSSEYGHNYDGVPGSGPQYGSVDGFSDGSARSMETDPEKWAEAYRNENGGPSPELVDPGTMIAKVNPQQAQQNYVNGSSSNHSSTATGTNSHPFQEGPEGKVQDIYFAFDSWRITPQAAEYLQEGAQWLLANPQNVVTIEGHCDQRGTQDYNLVLGKKRAEATRDYLLNLGIQAERVKIVSYGKERPFCEQQNENCYQENRRSHMVVKVN